MKSTLVARILFGMVLAPVFVSYSSDSHLGLERSWASSIQQTGKVELSKPFSIQQQGEAYWLVNSTGTRFFSFGVCCVDQGIARENYKMDAPAYAAWQHYPDSNQWAEATLSRLRSWGVTTIGGWSDFGTLKRCRDAQVTFTPVLSVGAKSGAPWRDMWDSKIIDRMDQIAREQILALRDDPRLLGYYSDNEMGWWNGALFQLTLQQAPTSGQRRRLVELLRQTYHSDWLQLLKDFDPEGATSFEELDQRGVLYLRGGSNGIRTMRRFLGMMAERYYSLVRELIRKYDQRALILGDRYQSFYYPEVAQASARHVDVVSGNLNASWNDGTFPRYYLDTLHTLTGRPVLVSEFYMTARENRSGNKNEPGFPVVDTQRERVAGFRRTLQTLVRIPYVVGADWFQYYDEPTHGRYDGENYSFGLVDIHNQPYEALVVAAASLDCNALKNQRHWKRPDTSQGVPEAPRDPLSEFVTGLALKEWDREQGFVKPASDLPMADLYVCWSPEALYFGLCAQDVVETDLYRDKVVPESDRAEWTITPGESNRTICARMGAGAKPVVNDTAVHVADLSGVDLNTHCIAAMVLPASLFGLTRFQAGDQIKFSSMFHTHCGVYRVEWRGTFRLRQAR